MVKNNKIVFVSLILVFITILIISFVLAAHVITTSSGGNSYSVNEDVGFIYNITINNTDTTASGNISQVNITIPNTFSFLANSNGTDAGTHTFTNTSTVFSWNNSGLVMNLTWKYFWFNVTASTPGNYNLTITTTNVTGSFSSNISVTINDTTSPSSINFVSPSESDNANLSRSNIAVNVTATDNGVISTIIVRLFNSTRNQINSSNSSTSPLFINFTGLSDGVYYFNATVNDTYGNSNSTSTRTITLDTTYPSLTINSPVLYANLSSRTITINLTANDSLSALNYVNITIYNSIGSIANSTTNSTAGISITSLAVSTDGIYTINATAYDFAGNINSTSRNVTVDTTYPLIDYGTGTENSSSNVSRSNIYVNVSVTETNEKNITFLLYNSTGQVNSTTFSTAVRTINWTGLADGTYTYNVTIRDHSGNLNTTSTRTITLDSSNPVITLIAPADSTSSTTSAYNFTFNVTDSQTISNCSLNFDGSIINTLTSVNNTGGTNGMYNSSLSVATHTWSINCTDIAGNTGNSSTRTLIVTAATASTTTSSISGGSGGGYPTFRPKEDELNKGYNEVIYQNWKVSFNVENISHTFKVENITETTAKISISSETQEAILSVGQEKKFELSGDNYYDLLVKLNSIDSTNKYYPKANITLKTISEEIVSQKQDKEESSEKDTIQKSPETELKEKKTNLTWLWILIAVIIILISFGIGYKKLKKK